MVHFLKYLSEEHRFFWLQVLWEPRPQQLALARRRCHISCPPCAGYDIDGMTIESISGMGRDKRALWLSLCDSRNVQAQGHGPSQLCWGHATEFQMVGLSCVQGVAQQFQMVGLSCVQGVAQQFQIVGLSCVQGVAQQFQMVGLSCVQGMAQRRERKLKESSSLL